MGHRLLVSHAKMYRTGLLLFTGIVSEHAKAHGGIANDALTQQFHVGSLFRGDVLKTAIEEYDAQLMQFTKFFGKLDGSRLRAALGSFIGEQSGRQPGAFYKMLFMTFRYILQFPYPRRSHNLLEE